MAQRFDNLVLADASGAFFEGYSHGTEVWPKYCQVINSDSDTERYSFPGALPQPRRMLDSRQFQGMLDFTFTIENYTYELSVSVKRESFEDDKTGLILDSFRRAGEAFKSWKDELFAQLLENGNVAGNTAYDGVVFHGDSRTIGSSGTIDNNTTSAASTGTTPTASELLDALNTNILALMWEYADDTGRPGMVKQAMSNIGIVIPSNMIRACAEAGNSTIIASNATSTVGGTTDNVYGKNLFTYDVLPNLSSDAEMFVNAVGSVTKPFIMQQRTPLQVEVKQDDMDVVKLLCRERFRFGYGEPRMSVLHTWT